VRGHAVPRCLERVGEGLQPRLVNWELARLAEWYPFDLPLARAQEIADQGNARGRGGHRGHPRGQPPEKAASAGGAGRGGLCCFRSHCCPSHECCQKGSLSRCGAAVDGSFAPGKSLASPRGQEGDQIRDLIRRQRLEISTLLV